VLELRREVDIRAAPRNEQIEAVADANDEEQTGGQLGEDLRAAFEDRHRQQVRAEDEEVAVVEEREPLGALRGHVAIERQRRLEAEDRQVGAIDLSVDDPIAGRRQDVMELQERADDDADETEAIERGRCEAPARATIAERAARHEHARGEDGDVGDHARDRGRASPSVAQHDGEEEHAEVAADEPVLHREGGDRRGDGAGEGTAVHRESRGKRLSGSTTC
jgi:hypothetical protein